MGLRLVHAGVLAVLAVDLGVFHRQAHAVTFRESLAWSTVWVALALAVNYGSTASAGPSGATWRPVRLEFLTGYLVEKALAVDNVFVFVLVFGYFGVPPATSTVSCSTASSGRSSSAPSS